MEKIPLLKRKPIFWFIQILGFFVVFFLAGLNSLSFTSLFFGILAVFLSMEILFLMLKPFLVYFIFFKYICFSLIIYAAIEYIDWRAFLLGMASVFFYLGGLSLEVLKHDSL